MPKHVALLDIQTLCLSNKDNCVKSDTDCTQSHRSHNSPLRTKISFGRQISLWTLTAKCNGKYAIY